MEAANGGVDENLRGLLMEIGRILTRMRPRLIIGQKDGRRIGYRYQKRKKKNKFQLEVFSEIISIIV